MSLGVKIGNNDIDEKTNTPDYNKNEKFDYDMGEYLQGKTNKSENFVDTNKDFKAIEKSFNNTPSNNIVILDESQYQALIKENNDLVKRLTQAQIEFSDLNNRHMILIEKVSNCLQKDTNKIELKLFDCFNFIRQSNEIINVSTENTPINPEKSKTDLDANITETNQTLKHNLNIILNQNKDLSHKLMLLDSIVMSDLKPANNNKVPKQSKSSKEFSNTNIVEPFNHSVSNKQVSNDAKSEPKTAKIISKQTVNNFLENTNLSRSLVSQNNNKQYDLIETNRRSKSENFVIASSKEGNNNNYENVE